MTQDNYLSPGAKFSRQHSRTPRPAVDHNGQPIGPPVVYTYDDAGRLVAVADPAQAGSDG